MLIAHISDSHVLMGGPKLGGRSASTAAFDHLIDSLARQFVRPDLILFSGDLGEDATEEEYAYIGAGLRSLGIPVRAVPGNHDARAPMLACLPDMLGQTAKGHLCLLDTEFPLAIIGLDTLVPSAPHGELCADRLAWLAAALETAANRPTLIFMHHPPITTGLQDMDRMGLLAGKEEFMRLVAAHQNVEAILCGHMHRSIHGQCGRARVCISPSASDQIAFDLRDDQPYRFTDEPAQYMMHLWQPAKGFISHVVSVAPGGP